MKYIEFSSQAWLVFCCLLVTLGLLIPQAHSLDADAPDLTTLSLQDLLAVELISAGKKKQPLSQVAAAAFVITAKDIRRSSATSIPDLLRGVPGLHVARIDANKWAITSRGFNGRFANKLLVLLDGRSVYTPLFSGVFWDVQDTVLEDIERIEIIRGPGATLWGSNAVNGIINIITKMAKDTQGNLLSAGFGNEERGFGTVRLGGQWDPNTHYRLYGKYLSRDGSAMLHGLDNLADDWSMGRGGFRVDRAEKGQDTWTLQGDLYRGNIGENITTFDPVPILRNSNEQGDVEGGNLLLHWGRQVSDQSDFALQIYYDRTERNNALFEEQRDTFDFEFQHHFGWGQRQEFVWGFGYRYTRDAINSSPFILIDPTRRDDDIFNAFLQDEVVLIAERLRLIVGSKFEHNDYSGFNYQPNLRLVWTPNNHHSLWSSVARALRTPSRGEQDGFVHNVGSVIQPPSPAVPIVAAIVGNRNLDDEELLAYELGYRYQSEERFSLDLAYFYHDYKDLRGIAVGAPICEPLGTPFIDPTSCLSLFGASHVLVPTRIVNGGEGPVEGLELTFDWQPKKNWQIQASYSYLRSKLRGMQVVADSPRHQFSLRTSMPLGRTISLDLHGRFVEGIGNFPGFTEIRIDNYIGLDAVLTWRPHKSLEFSLVGRDLLEGQHTEFISELGDIPPAEVERSVMGRLRWKF